MTKIMLNISIILCAIIIMVTGFSNSAFAASIDKVKGFISGEMEPPVNSENAPAEAAIDFSQPLTLEKCIDIALTRSVDMKTGKLDLALEDMNVSDARSSYLPRVDTSGSYQFSDTVDFGWEKENYNASVSARYTIWDHGQREGSLAQAKSRREGRDIGIYRTRQSLIFSIISSYYSVLEAEKLISVDENALERSKQNVEKIKAFVEVGDAIESDVATARVLQANDELTLVNDLNNLELAKANMAALMGLDPNTKFSIVDDLDYEKFIQTGDLKDSQVEADRMRLEAISMDDAVTRAMDKRPEVAELKTNRAILETALTLAQLERWPKITADCGYNIFLDDYLRERDALKNHKSWDVQAGVSYPLFDNGRTRRTVERADIALLKLNENAAELKRSITLEVYQAYLSLERSRKSLDISSIQVEDAKMSLDVVQGRYEQQMTILLDLIEAQARYIRSLSNQVKTFYDYKVATKTLDKAMGVL
jgi:outer membrane protein